MNSNLLQSKSLQSANLHPLFRAETPQIMGILNVTPDSFSDGARYQQIGTAMAHAEQMLAAGANIIDIGGESTRPGAAKVSVADELARVIPLIEPIKKLGVRVSVDTSKPEVMLAAAAAGADMLNDVFALSKPGALAAAAASGLPVCLMHMQGQPQSMQQSPEYVDVVLQVKNYLQQRIDACIDAGISLANICIDPGFGFGKTLKHNLLLLKNLNQLESLKVPILVGLSRKSMLGEITGRATDQRLAGSLAVALVAMQQGASIIRVHDVAQTQDIKKIYLALK